MVDRSTATSLGWGFILFYCIVFTPFQFFVPTANTFLYTFQSGTPPGTLFSQRWSYPFVVSCSFFIMWFIPITFAFALTATARSTGSIKFHYVLTVLFTVWVAFSFLFGCIEWAHANNPGASNANNRANDIRWCSINYPVASPPCANTAPFSPAVSQSMLVTNELFLMQLWYSFVLMIVLVLDLIFFGCVIVPAVTSIEDEGASAPSLADAGDSISISMTRPLYKPRTRK